MARAHRTTSATKQPAYVVIRWSWTEADQKKHGMPLAAFTDPDQAEAYRIELEEAAQRDVSPFSFSGNYLKNGTSLSEPALIEQLGKLGIAPPSADTFPIKNNYAKMTIDWVRWWEATAGELSASQVQAVWRLMDRVSYYRVVKSVLRD